MNTLMVREDNNGLITVINGYGIGKYVGTGDICSVPTKAITSFQEIREEQWEYYVLDIGSRTCENKNTKYKLEL